MHICILGAGAVGLSSAVLVQKNIQEATITIIADRFLSETTSNGAAGIFRPTLTKTPGVPLPLLKKWLKDSFNHYNEIIHSEDAGLAGIQMLSGYQLFDAPENELEKENVYHYRPLTQKELNIFPGNLYKNGWFVSSLLVECGRYLPYLMKEFKRQGGNIIKKKIESLEELVGRYDLVINCTGCGSRTLFNDHNLIPNRGHVIKVKAPWLKHFIYTDGECYIIPGLEFVTIGGTRTDNDDMTSARIEDRRTILERAFKVCPSLKNADIVYEWVGFRPFRQPLRVEKELIVYPSGQLKVVHNYGHGAEGISLSWGTSIHAVNLACAWLLKSGSKI